jgi:hypothetical protein
MKLSLARLTRPFLTTTILSIVGVLTGNILVTATEPDFLRTEKVSETPLPFLPTTRPSKA